MPVKKKTKKSLNTARPRIAPKAVQDTPSKAISSPHNASRAVLYEYRTSYMRYALAVCTCITAFFLTQLFWPVLYQTPFMLFFGAVAVTALYGGWGAGALTILGSVLIIAFFFLPPTGMFWIGDQSDLHRLMLFIGVSSLIAWTASLRKRSEDELKSTKNQLEVIFKSVADGISVQDKTGKLYYANDGAAKIIGYPDADALLQAPMKELLGRFEILDEFGKPFDLNNLPGRRALTGEEQSSEVIICYKIKATGELRWSLVKAAPIYDENGKIRFAVNVFHDITEQRQIERRKDEFIGIASHELKTPLTSLKAFSQLLERHLEKKGDDTSRLYISKMEEQVGRMASLIGDLLDISRIHAGKLDLRKEVFDINDVVERTVGDMQQTTTQKIKVKRTSALIVEADRHRVEQVIVNLLTNAFKYSGNAEYIEVRLSKKDGYACVEVEDYGIGVPKKQQEKIFERFYRAQDDKRENVPGGLGLGLYITRQIIERHRGTITVKSTLGKGSTFSFTIPLKEPVK